MNNVLKINKTKITPEIIYDNDNNTLSIVGESSPENALTFYQPIIQWVDQKLVNSIPVSVSIQLDYFNTTTAKMLIRLFEIMDSYYLDGIDINVIWICKSGDIDLAEAIEELLEPVNFKYQILN